MRVHRRLERRAGGSRLAGRMGLLAGLLSMILLCAPESAHAWDNLTSTGSSHWRMLEGVIDQVPLPAADQGDEANIHSLLLNGSVYEGAHYQRRAAPIGCEYWRQATGNNPGSLHPELWWQSALCYYRAGDHNTAYSLLGYLIHLVEDQSAPPHTYYVMHGEEWYDQDPFEVLAAVSALNLTYYQAPWEESEHPGKNILDEDSHYNSSDARWELHFGVSEWAYVTTTNLQAPAPQQIIVDASIVGCGFPDQVYLLAGYDRIDGSLGWQQFGPFSPRCTGWTRWTLAPDSFAPNGSLYFYYARLEDCCDWWTGQLRVYVSQADDIVGSGELQKPSLQHPWQYYDWLRGWSLWATRAPFWRAYNSMSQSPAPLDFDLTWETAPNSERALLSLQWRATCEAVKWLLQDAYARFADPGYTVEEAAGSGYRVVLYDQVNFNSNPGEDGPAFLFSQALACEPDTDAPCAAFVPSIARPDHRAPILDGDFTTAGQGDQVSLSSNTLGFMSQKISSLEVRGARVTLYTGLNLDQGSQHKVFVKDTPDLGSFGDQARSIRIEPPTIDALSGLLWLDANQDGVKDAGDTPLPGVQVSLHYDAHGDGVWVEMPGSPVASGGDGRYNFEKLFAGIYEVRIDSNTLPSGIGPLSDRDGLTTPNRARVTLVAGQSMDDLDFGYIALKYTYLPLLKR